MADSPPVDFTIEWEQASGVLGDEHRATWARFELWVNGKCVTQVEDTVSGSARRSIYVSLYPLAEWIAFNWWQLSYDHRSTWLIDGSRLRDSQYRKRVWSEIRSHRVREAGDGFLWPDLAILPEDNGQMVLDWRSDRQASDEQTVRFISSGYERVSSTELLHVLSTVVEQVIHRLREQGIAKSTLTDEWDNISSADQAERDFCVTAAQLGLDPYSEEALSLEQGIVRAGASLSGEVLTDFLGVARVGALDDELDWILTSADEVGPAGRDSLQRAASGQARTNDGRYPWLIGWQSAASLRAEYGLSPTDQAPMENWIETLTRPTSNRAMQGLGVAEGRRGGRLVLAKDYASRSRRFTEARALWHVADDPNGIFLVVATYGTRQRIERAFAAEFLAPAEGVRQMIPDPELVTPDELDKVADRFEVSPLVIQHQIENQLSGAILE